MTSRIWQEAVRQSETSLSEEERRLYGNSCPQDILQDLQNQQFNYNQTSKIENFLAKIEPLLLTIEAVAAIACSSPGILSPAWGTLRLLILMVRKEDLSDLVKMLQEIEIALSRFRDYEELFHNDEPLQRHLSEMYLELISLFSNAKKILCKSSSNRPFKNGLGVFRKNTFDRHISKLKEFMDLIKEDATVAHMKASHQERRESAQGRKESAEWRSFATTELFPNELEPLKSWLDARQCDEEKGRIQILPDTCEWILEKRYKFTEWLGKDETRLFWMYGPPGCGKSFLYAKMLRHIDETTKCPYVYFLFCGADGERVKASHLLQSWTFQLAKHFNEAREHATVIRRASENRQATPKEVADLFQALLDKVPAGRSCILAVDALDECINQEEFYRILPLIPRRFKILVTSRYLTGMSKHLQKTPEEFHTSLEILPEMTQSDIDTYIALELKELALRFPPETISRVEERLADSNGMFLGVKLMLQYINLYKAEEWLLKCLEENEMPNKLSEMYKRFLDEINRRDKPDRDLAHQVFFWVSVARKPLRIKEVCALLAVKPTERDENAFVKTRRIRCDPEGSVLKACGSLLTARGPNQILYPIHFTATEYLKKYMTSAERLAEITAYYDVRQLQSNDSLAAAVCIRYLTLDFIASISNESISDHSDARAIFHSDDPNLDILEYAVSHWAHHFERVGSPEPLLLRIATEFLDGDRRSLDVSWRLYLFSKAKSTGPLTSHHDISGNHIAAYFGLHHLLRHRLPTQTLLDRVLRYLFLNSGQWEVDPQGELPLRWAVRQSHVQATKVLVESGMDPNLRDKYGKTAVHTAAALGNTEVFETIMSVKPRIAQTIVNFGGWTPLHYACSKGHLAIVKMILHPRDGCRSYGTLNSITQRGRSPLHVAAQFGNVDVISEIVNLASQNRKGLLNRQEENGSTALHLSASIDNIQCVEELVGSGADVNICDHSGRTAADVALELGHMAVYERLTRVSKSTRVTSELEQDMKKTMMIKWVNYGILSVSLLFCLYLLVS